MVKKTYTKKRAQRKPVNVLLTEQEKDIIVQYATMNGVSISEYIRMRALGIHKDGGAPTKYPPTLAA